MYHHQRDSGICLEEDANHEQPKPHKDKVQNGSAVYLSLFPPKSQRGMLYNQLTENQRSKLFNGWIDSPFFSDEPSMPRILSGYPIPYHFTNFSQPEIDMDQSAREQRQSPKKETESSGSSRPKRHKDLRKEKVSRFYNLMCGVTPTNREDFQRKFPAEFEKETIRNMRRQSTELLQKLGELYKIQSRSVSTESPLLLPGTVVYKPEMKEEEEEIPDQWFNSIDEAWAYLKREENKRVENA